MKVLIKKPVPGTDLEVGTIQEFSGENLWHIAGGYFEVIKDSEPEKEPAITTKKDAK